MDNIQELVSKLNGLRISQTSMDFIEDLPEEIYEQYFKNSQEVDSDLYVDKHRWYEESTTVIRLKMFPEDLLGINLVSNLYSESASVDDLYHILEFFEVEEVSTITYKRK